VDAFNRCTGRDSARDAGVGASDQDNVYKLLRNLKAFRKINEARVYLMLWCLWEHADDPFPVIAQGVWEAEF